MSEQKLYLLCKCGEFYSPENGRVNWIGIVGHEIHSGFQCPACFKRVVLIRHDFKGRIIEGLTHEKNTKNH